jgi:hypothetical protein
MKLPYRFPLFITTALLACVLSPTLAPAATPTAPTVATGGVTGISAQGATLLGTLNAENFSTTAYFRYYYVGNTGTVTSTTSTISNSSGTVTPLSETITGLQSATVYHYQAIATTSTSTVTGAVKAFSTLKVPVFNNASPQAPLLSAGAASVGVSVNPGGVATQAYFLYGTSSNNLNLTSATVNLGAARTSVPVTALLSGLAASTTYYYELVTTSAAGTFTSQVFSFTSLSFTVSPVVATGDPTTLLTGSGTATFLAFSAPTVNSNDEVAYVAQLNQSRTNPVVNTGNYLGLWVDDGTGTYAPVAQTSSTGASPDALAPGTTAGYSSFTNVPLINSSNQIAFGATLRIGGGQATYLTQNGVWCSNSGSLQLLARQSGPAPGGAITTGTATFAAFKGIAQTDDGAAIFADMNFGAGVTGLNNEGIWEGTQASDLALVIRTGDVVSHTTGTTTITRTLVSPIVLGSADPVAQGQMRAFNRTNGDIAVLAYFSNLTTGIVTNSSGSLTLAYAVGDNAPVTTGSATFTKFSDPIINANDRVAFGATLGVTGSITLLTDEGIWAQDSAGTLQLVAQAGVPTAAVTGTSTGTYTFRTLGDPVYNDNEATAFEGTYLTSSRLTVTALFCNSTGTLTNVAQTLQQAPGCPTGVVFSKFTEMDLPNAGGAGGHGGLVFAAALSGPGVTLRNNYGIWAVDSSGTPQLIVRLGQTVNTGTNSVPVFKTIAAVYFSSFTTINAGQSLGVAPNGDISYDANFGSNVSTMYVVQF